MARGYIVLNPRDLTRQGIDSPPPPPKTDYATHLYFLCLMTLLNVIFGTLVFICNSDNQQLRDIAKNITSNALRVRI